MHSFRFNDVRLSSSIIPHLIVYFSNLKTFSTFSKIKLVKEHSSGPCCFGLTIIIDPVLEFFFSLRSCIEHNDVTNASSIPSGISDPSLSRIHGLVIK